MIERYLKPDEAGVMVLAKMLTAEQAAECLGVSRSWILAHANGSRRPKLPSAKLGKLVRFHPEELKKFVEECGR